MSDSTTVTLPKTPMVAQSLSDCKPGDQVTITGTIASDDPSGITLNVQSATYADDGEPGADDTAGGDESDAASAAPAPQMDPIDYALKNRGR